MIDYYGLCYCRIENPSIMLPLKLLITLPSEFQEIVYVTVEKKDCHLCYRWEI